MCVRSQKLLSLAVAGEVKVGVEGVAEDVYELQKTWNSSMTPAIAQHRGAEEIG